MNNNPNDPQELECQLRAKAVAELQESIIRDLECEDKSIAEILGKDTNEDKATEDDLKEFVVVPPFPVSSAFAD